MVKPDISKDHLLIIKCVEESGWPTVSTDLTTIPPLGTKNKDGAPTSSLSIAACEGDATFKVSKPVLPTFEILYNHTAVSFKTEPDKIDKQDTSRPKRFTRGHDTYTGSLDWDLVENDNRVDEAVSGDWNPDKLSQEPYKHFLEYMLWSMRNPRDTNGKITMNKNAVQCDRLVAHYGLIFDSSEVTDEGAVRLSTPISRSMFRKFNKHTFPTDAEEMEDETDAVGTLVPTTQPREYTRLNLVISVLTGTGTISFIGTNVFKEPVTLVFTASVASLLSLKWIDVIDEIVISPGITAVTFKLYDYDYTIKDPALK